MPVYNMITGLNAATGEGDSIIEGFDLSLYREGNNAIFGAADGQFLKEAYVRTPSYNTTSVEDAAFGFEVGLSPPYCVSFKTTRFDCTTNFSSTTGIAGLATALNNSSGADFELSPDHTQIRAAGSSTWLPVPASAAWRDSEPNTFELSVAADGSVAVFMNGVEITGLGLVAPNSGAGLWFRVFSKTTGYGHDNPYLSAGQFVVSGAPLLAYDIPVLRPSADRTSVGFAPDTGTEMFSRINETVPDGDTSYVSASYGGDNALFRYTDADGNALALDPAQTVKAIKHTTQAKLDEAGNRELASVYQDGGNAEVTAGSVGVTGEYALRSQIIEVNPLTGVAWQPDDFDDWSFGFQIVEE